MSNCLFEAAFENILERCRCAPGFHTMGGDEAMDKFEICMGANLTCMNDLMNRMGEFDHVDYQGKQTKCRSACEDQVNSLFVTTSSYPNRKTLIYREEFCIVTNRLIKKCKSYKRKPLDREYPNICNLIQPLEDVEFCPNDEWRLPKHLNCSNNDCPVVEAILDYAKDNLVMFNIFIKDPYAKRFMKDEKITKTAYIANSGGLLDSPLVLGLCMGFSLVSAAEILYHCLFGLFSPICGRGKKNSKDTLYRVYTYSRDLENGLCDRHKKAEIVRLSEFQKQESVSIDKCKESDHHLVECEVTEPHYPGLQAPRSCALHNGTRGGSVTPCPAHGPMTSSNGCIPAQLSTSAVVSSSKKYSFSPERVI